MTTDYPYGEGIDGTAIGKRVVTHPATDAWMSGDRYGTVDAVSGGGYAYVRLDRSGKIRKFHPDNLALVDG